MDSASSKALLLIPYLEGTLADAVTPQFLQSVCEHMESSEVDQVYHMLWIIRFLSDLCDFRCFGQYSLIYKEGCLIQHW